MSRVAYSIHGLSPRRARSARPTWPFAPVTRTFLGEMGTTSRRRGCALSFSEMCAVSNGMGQGIAAVSSARLRKLYWASGDQWSFTR